MSRTQRNQVDLTANPTKRVSKRALHRKVRTDARETLHRIMYFEEPWADFGLCPYDLFKVKATKLPDT